MLEIKNLKASIKDNIIIENATLYLEAGEIVKISGVNGSGKSTLLNSIFKTNNTSVTFGEIILDSKNINDLKSEEIAKLGIYYAITNAPAIKGVSTIQILYKAYKNFHPDSKINILVFKSNLEIKCKEYDLDVNLINGDLNTDLSSGQKKMSMLIHVLALKPKYVLLDEPDSSVDNQGVEIVYKSMLKLKQEGVGVLFTSHNVKSDKSIFDREYILKDKVLTELKSHYAKATRDTAII